jgi:Domain of unknown function (DUF4388)/Type II secretion system (T2SS), protein G
MALQGSIKDFGLPDIFQLIGLQRKTGVLTLKSGSESVTVTFENGMVVNADSSSKRMEDRLGNLLVKQGKLSEERLEEVLLKQKQTLQRLGHILVAGNYILPKDLKEALQVQVSQTVFKLFRWKQGDYHFEPTEKVEFDRANFNPMSADFILMEGIRMLDEWPIIEKKIPSMDIVFRSAVDASSIVVSSGDEADDSQSGKSSSKIRLSGDEGRVYRKVDGSRSVQGIIDASGLSDFDACKALYDLLTRNIVAPMGRAGAARAAEGPQEAPGPGAGYGLLAAAALLSVAGLALQLRTPFGVLGRPAYLRSSLSTVMGGVSRARLERLDQAVLAYRLAKGALPQSLSDLVQARLADARDVKDPWARPYHYALDAGGYTLSAVGPDGQPLPETLIQRAVSSGTP